MRRFQFSLEKVLRVRGHETDAARQSLAEALLEAERCRRALQKAADNVRACEADWEQRQGQRMTVMQWSALVGRHDGLLEVQKARQADLDAALALVSTRQTELAEARRRERALELLKERQWEAYQQEALAAEQAETDEIAQNMQRTGKEVSLR